MLVILLAQVTITLVLTSAKPHVGFTQLHNPGSNSLMDARYPQPQVRP